MVNGVNVGATRRLLLAATIVVSTLFCGAPVVCADVMPNPAGAATPVKVAPASASPASVIPGTATPATAAGSASVNASSSSSSSSSAAAAPVAAPTGPLSQAEIWVRDRFNPGGESAAAELKKAKHPVRSFFKGVAKGTAKELGTSLHLMAEDSAFVFSVQDVDPYESNRPPRNKQAIVMEMTMTDGTTCYLHHFPDGSFAVEGGFADGTVILPRTATQYLVKYPNGVSGNLVRQRDLMTIHRPDNTVTTFKRTAGGGWEVSNSKVGYIGEAHPDDQKNIELNSWSNSDSD
jgi:hypothetical protein